ncbi:MAG: hypothetical protein ABSE55_09270 [Terracidiphilus sp.]|jgi:hypothetical protein
MLTVESRGCPSRRRPSDHHGNVGKSAGLKKSANEEKTINFNNIILAQVRVIGGIFPLKWSNPFGFELRSLPPAKEFYGQISTTCGFF